MKLIIFVLLFFLLHVPEPEAQAPFYQGKTITIARGGPAGTVNDAYARVLAQFMPKYIPGNPNIIVQSIPGAGSMIAANYVYTVAKPDGLTMARSFRRSTSTNSWAARRCSLTGPNSVGSATQPR